MNKRKAMCKPFTREAQVERYGNVEVRSGHETQEVEMSLSSEFAVERWFGMEVLGHGRNEVRLGRLNNGGPLLVNHNTDDQIGAFKRDSVSIADKKMRGIARFSRSARAKEIADDIEDDIRGATSVGYIVHEFTRERELETINPDTGETEMKWWRATDWEPLEGSIVPVAADPNTGVGRFFEKENECWFVGDDDENHIEHKEHNTVTDEERKSAEAAAKTVAADLESARTLEVKKAREESAATAATGERGRIAEIQEVGSKMNLKPELVKAAIESGESADSFRKAVFATWKPEDVQSFDGRIGMNDSDVKTYSICRAVVAMMNNDWKDAGFEREVNTAAAEMHERMGLAVKPNSITIPLDVRIQHSRQERMAMQRSTIVAGSTEGIELVGTDKLGNQFIDALRNKVRVIEAGATSLTGLVGNVDIPRQVAHATAVQSAENAAFTEAVPTYDVVSMSPKVVNTLQPMSVQLLIQGSVDVEAMVRRDLALGIGLQIDDQCIYGSGTPPQVDGIKNQTGVVSLNFAESAATWAGIVSAETGVANLNADVGDMKWIVNSKTRGAWKTTVKETGVAEYLWNTKENPTPVNGESALVSNQLKNNTGTGNAFSEAVYGNWPQAVLGFWGGVNLIVDPFTLAGTNIVRIVVSQHWDFMLRHGESFAFVIGIEN